MTKKKGSPVLRRRSPAWVQEHRLDRIEELKHPVVIPRLGPLGPSGRNLR